MEDDDVHCRAHDVHANNKQAARGVRDYEVMVAQFDLLIVDGDGKLLGHPQLASMAPSGVGTTCDGSVEHHVPKFSLGSAFRDTNQVQRLTSEEALQLAHATTFCHVTRGTCMEFNTP